MLYTGMLQGAMDGGTTKHQRQRQRQRIFTKRTLLYQIIQTYYPEFLGYMESQGKALPNLYASYTLPEARTPPQTNLFG